MGGHVVLVVQNSQFHEHLIQGLASEGYCALCFRSVEEAVSYLREPGCPASVVAFDISLRRQSDFVALADLSALRPELRILFNASESNQGTSPDFPQRSAAAGQVPVYPLDKPLNHPDSGRVLREALSLAASAASEASLEAGTTSTGLNLPYSEEFLRRVGLADVPVLLSGETGVGKEVMARRLRSYSRRSEMPFLKLNCAALPPELAESELFGSVKGAFTGATADRPGRFEIAQGGTILLDEIGDMDLRLQTKLLQVLQDGEIQPLGSNRTIKVNVRVMAATHRDLTRAIQEGTFREDLYYRLNVIKLTIPPLRERAEEILPLANALLTRHLPQGQKMPVMNDELKRFLLSYRWPGNVRELENVMRRFIVYQDASLIIRELLDTEEEFRSTVGQSRSDGIVLPESARFPTPRPPNPRTESSDRSAAGRIERIDKVDRIDRLDRTDRPESLDQLAEAVRIAETELILNALDANRWNRRQAAASLQIEYKAFLYKMQKYGIVTTRGKRGEASA